jgi:hypothetical protein
MTVNARFRDTKEVRGFHRLRRTTSSGRILNLVALSEAASRPRADKDGTPVTTEKLFHTNTLNYAILVKHNIRPHERELFSRNVQVGTKIFLPFDPKRLDVGGCSFFIEEDGFKESLKDLINLDAGGSDPHAQHDIKVLETLSRSPTLDPFIITECLRAEGIVVEPTLFSDSYTVMLKASSDVFEVFKPLVQKALGKIASPIEMTRFVEQVWNVNSTTTSNPFLEALQIPQTEWANVIFSWKALIYYDISSRDSPERLRRVFSILKEIEPKNRVSQTTARELLRLKKDFGRKLYSLHDGSSVYIRQALTGVVDAILNQSDAAAISTSLRSLAKNITAVGMDVVLFDQVTSYFLFLFPKTTIRMDGDELEAELTNLCEIIELRDQAKD